MQIRRILPPFLLCIVSATAFHLSPTQTTIVNTHVSNHNSRSRIRVKATENSVDKEEGCWNPRLRKVLGGIAGAGMLETTYLTLTEVSGGSVMCLDQASSCSSVLTGPYAQIPGTDIPLAALGFLAYFSVFGLALGPLLSKQQSAIQDDDDDSLNRILLTAVTTTMGVFSVFLMFFLFGVLKESCPYCIASAVFSITLAKLSWLGGAIPKEKFKQGLNVSLGGAATALLAAVVLFSGGSDVSTVNVAGELATPRPSGMTLLAKANTNGPLEPQSPPPITTDSTPDALRLARDLESLDTTFYGAFWCSHCYDQKQTLGKQAMSKIPYVECSKDGADAQVSLCKSKQLPGYPTWEIKGKLYPGEQAIEELREIVENARAD